MRRTHHRSIIALAAAAALVPAAAAGAQDLRSPDARDAGVVPPATADLRSPDARHGVVADAPFLPNDVRSPDARDTSPVDLGAPDVVVSADDRLDWGDVGIGAGGAAIVLLSLGSGVVAVRRRSHVPTVAS